MRLKVDFFEADSFEKFDYLNVDFMGFPLQSEPPSYAYSEKVYLTHLQDISVADFEWQIQRKKLKYLQIPSGLWYLDFLKYLNNKGIIFFFDRITYDTDSNIDFLKGTLSDFPKNFDYRVIVELFTDYENPWVSDQSEYANEKFYEIKEILEKDFVYTSVSSGFFETPLTDRKINLNGLNITVARDTTLTPGHSMKIADARKIVDKLIL